MKRKTTISMKNNSKGFTATLAKLLLLLCVFSSFLATAQSASTYSFTATTITYADLTGTTNLGGMSANSDEDLSSTTNIGFTFNFAGTNYTQFKASSNGFVTFNTSATNAFYENTQANAGSSKPILMPLWDDLKSTVIVRYKLEGSSPNRILKIEYSGNKWDYNASAITIKFQVWLYETSNRIEYRYLRNGNATKNLNDPSATIGIYDAGATYLTLDGSGSSPSASSTTFTTTIDAKPVNNQVFRFDPPTNPTITTSVASLTQFTACNLTPSTSQSFEVSGIRLSANIVITAPTGFEVSTNNTNFFATRTLNQSGGTVASTTIYARMKSLSSSPSAGNIAITSTGATTKNISVTGLLLSPTGVSAGTDVASCAGLSIALTGAPSPNPVAQVLSTINDNTGFTTMTTNDATRWGISASNNAGGTANELRMQYSTGATVNSYIQSPLLDASNYTALSMTFKHNLDWYEATAPLFMETSPDGTTWTTRWNLNATGNVAANTVTVDLSALNNSSFYYRFSYQGNTYNIDYWYIDDVVISGTYAVPVTYAWTSSPSGFTSAIQSPTVAPTATTTYTLAVTSNGCTVTDDVVVTLTSTSSSDGISWSNGIPTGTKDAILTGASPIVLTTDLTACSLIVNGPTVSVASGFNVDLNGAMIVNTGSFTLNNNSNLIQHNSNFTNTGNIIVKRNSAAINRLDYTLWSSPVIGQGLYAFSKFTLPNRFYFYDPSIGANGNYNNSVGFNLTGLQYPSPLVSPNGVDGTDSANITFAAGKGYLIRVPYNHPTTATSFEGIFTGVPNNGDINIGSLTSGKYYAIGNPYPSTISADDFISDNGIGISPAIDGDGLYFWRKTNNAAVASYATYTSAGGTASGGDPLNIQPNGVIQVGEGFIVKATSPAIGFNNAHRVANNDNQFLKTTAIERNRIWLNLSDSVSTINQMMVSYMTGATQGIDAGIDGRYFNDSTTALNSLVNNEEFAIQGRSLPFETSDSVPLAFKAATAGNYTIAIDQVDGLFTDGAQVIYLKDNLTNTFHNLTAGGYDFASTIGTFNNRFELVYQTQLANTTFTLNTVVIYSQNNEFLVNSGNTIMASIKVFDIRGRLIEEKTKINANQTTIKGGLANQVLLVQITSEDGITVTKKVIR